MDDRPVLVAGGTGFIGSHVVESLAAAGTRVIAVSRQDNWRWGARPGGVTLEPVDLANPSSEPTIRDLARRCRSIVNLAGMLLRPGRRDSVYRDLHVDGTRRLVEAARAAATDPIRLVHVSTTGVLGPTGPEPLDEDAPPHPSTVYETTKLEGERIARGARGSGLDVVVIRPGLVYGPRDLHLLPLYKAIAKGTYRNVAGGRALWQPIYVQDVARGIVTALEHPAAPGEVFHMAGSEVVSVAELSRRIAGQMGTSVRRPGLPFGLAMATGWMLETVCRPFRVPPPLTTARVRTLTSHRRYRIDRARERLGFVPEIGLDEGIARTLAWYRSHGHLR